MKNTSEDAIIAWIDFQKNNQPSKLKKNNSLSKMNGDLDRGIFGSYVSVYLSTQQPDLKKESRILVQHLLEQGHNPEVILKKTHAPSSSMNPESRARAVDLLSMMLDLHGDSKITLSEKQLGRVNKQMERFLIVSRNQNEIDPLTALKVASSRWFSRNFRGFSPTC